MISDKKGNILFSKKTSESSDTLDSGKQSQEEEVVVHCFSISEDLRYVAFSLWSSKTKFPILKIFEIFSENFLEEKSILNFENEDLYAKRTNSFMALNISKSNNGYLLTAITISNKRMIYTIFFDKKNLKILGSLAA